jgi:hypothetical protein
VDPLVLPLATHDVAPDRTRFIEKLFALTHATSVKNPSNTQDTGPNESRSAPL